MAIYIDYRWFSSEYTQQQQQNLICGLKSLIDKQPLQVEQQTLNILAEVLLQYTMPLNELKQLEFDTVYNELLPAQRQDMLVMALILSLCSTENVNNRLNKLLTYWSDEFLTEPAIKSALTAIANGNSHKIQSSHILDLAYHNTFSRLNGIETLGWAMYNTQMKSMKKGKRVPKLKEKFDFMNELASNTLGGKLRDIMRKQKLSLPGEAYGFAEFFLWHDIAHLLSGNNQNFKGELGANAFTAAFSKKAKYSILLFGILQWNLDISLAIVASTAKNHLTKVDVLKKYCESILIGSKTTLDLLDWPTEIMIEDLKMDLEDVRRKYNIHLHPQLKLNDT